MPSKDKYTPCPCNVEVTCMHPDRCPKCGWNPEVAAQRTMEIRKKLGLPPEETPCREG